MNVTTAMKPKVNTPPAVGGGIHASSSNENYFIFASTMSKDEVEGTLQYMEIGYKCLVGSYKMEETGEVVKENSYIVNTRHLERIRFVGLLDGQESILVLSEGDWHNKGLRTATLVYNQTKETKPNQELGYLVPVSEEEALKEDNWSYDPTQKTYFIVKEKE